MVNGKREIKVRYRKYSVFRLSKIIDKFSFLLWHGLKIHVWHWSLRGPTIICPKSRMCEIAKYWSLMYQSINHGNLIMVTRKKDKVKWVTFWGGQVLTPIQKGQNCHLKQRSCKCIGCLSLATRKKELAPFKVKLFLWVHQEDDYKPATANVL